MACQAGSSNVTAESRARSALDTINHWIEMAVSRNVYFLNQDDEKQLISVWKELGRLLKENSITSIEIHTSVLWNTFRLVEESFNVQHKKSPFNVISVCFPAFDCAVLSLTEMSIASDNNPDFDLEYFKFFDEELVKLVVTVIKMRMQLNRTLLGPSLDLMGAIGNIMFSRLPEDAQKRMLVFLITRMGIADRITPPIEAKFGRCLGKLIEFEGLQQNLTFFMDVFGKVQVNIVSTENVIKNSYAWTFANLTDTLVEVHMNQESQLVRCSTTFVRDLLSVAEKSLDVPIKGRYSSCRACGNVYKWAKSAMLEIPENCETFKRLTRKLVDIIGHGMDYKLRWNAAHAVGHALENKIFHTMMAKDINTPILTTLAKWAAVSQSYKERTQCVESLMKVTSREEYGSLYSHLWDRAASSMTGLPVDCDCDNSKRFKITIVRFTYHLASLITLEDLRKIESTIEQEFENIKAVVTDIATDIPLEDLDGGMRAKEVLKSFKHTPQNSVVCMLLELVNLSCTGKPETATDEELL